MLILSNTIYKSDICTILCTTAGVLNLEVLCAFCPPEPSADTLENSWNPDQARQIIEPDHDPNCLILFLKELFFKKGCFEKINRRQKNMKITQKGTEERYRGLKICVVINFCRWY